MVVSRGPSTPVRELRFVILRLPTEKEIERWTSRLDDYGNGVIMASAFLIFAPSELAAKFQAAPPPRPRSADLSGPLGQPMPYPIPGGIVPS